MGRSQVTGQGIWLSRQAPAFGDALSAALSAAFGAALSEAFSRP